MIDAIPKRLDGFIEIQYLFGVFFLKVQEWRTWEKNSMDKDVSASSHGSGKCRACVNIFCCIRIGVDTRVVLALSCLEG